MGTATARSRSAHPRFGLLAALAAFLPALLGCPKSDDPAYYIEAAARIGMPLSQCIIVEDSRAGLEAARRAGPARLIAIDTMLSEDELQKEPGIYAVIHDFTGFARYLAA